MKQQQGKAGYDQIIDPILTTEFANDILMLTTFNFTPSESTTIMIDSVSFHSCVETVCYNLYRFFTELGYNLNDDIPSDIDAFYRWLQQRDEFEYVIDQKYEINTKIRNILSMIRILLNNESIDTLANGLEMLDCSNILITENGRNYKIVFSHSSIGSDTVVINATDHHCDFDIELNFKTCIDTKYIHYDDMPDYEMKHNMRCKCCGHKKSRYANCHQFFVEYANDDFINEDSLARYMSQRGITGLPEYYKKLHLDNPLSPV
jgi:hypothetical protein